MDNIRQVLHELIHGDPAEIASLKAEIERLTAENERLMEALARVAGMNDLSGVSEDALPSAAYHALHECELIARDAIDALNQQLTPQKE